MGINLFEVLRVYPNLFESEEAKAAYLSADDATKGHMLSTRLFKELVERTDELTALKKEKISTYHGAMDTAMKLIDSLESQNQTMCELVNILRNVITEKDERIAMMEAVLKRMDETKNGQDGSDGMDLE